MTLTKKIQFLALLAAFALVACSGSGDDDDFGNSQVESTAEGGQGSAVRSTPIILPESFSGVLVEVTDSMRYQPTQFAEELANLPYFGIGIGIDYLAEYIEPIFKLAVNSRVPRMDQLFRQEYGEHAKWQVERYLFTYHSISLRTGADTVLVGAVTFPNNTVAGLNHEVGTLTLHHHQAAFLDSWLPSKSPSMMTLHALHNSAVIEPDFLEAGDNIPELTVIYLNSDILAQQMTHCVMAALDVMRQHGVRLADDGYTNNWGSSLGMPSALGFTEYIENEAPEELVDALRLKATFVGEGYTKFSHLLMSEVAEIPTPPYKINMGWHPQKPLYMSCGPNDDLISYSAFREYWEELATNADGTLNPNVHWTDFYVANTELQKMVGGNHFVASILLLFYMSCAEDPADMVEYLR